MAIPTAIVIAGVLIAASLFLALGGSTKTNTITVIPQPTETVTSTSLTHTLTFQQVRYCGLYNILPWAVTVDGLTEVQPSNQTLPLPTNTFSTTVSNQTLTRITFSLPDGTYDYVVWGGTPHGPGGQLYPDSGTVLVNGSDVLVDLMVYLSFTCTSTTAVTITSSYSISSSSGAGAPSISTVALANATLSGFPGEIAVDSNNSRIYVVDLFANKLSVIDATNDELAGTITLPSTSGFGLAVDPQRNGGR